MKAIVYTKYGPPSVIKLIEVEKPTPKDNEVLVKIYATTVTNSGGFMRRGRPYFGRLFLGLTKPKNPIPGTDLAGEIELAGKDVKKFKKGDKVFAATDISFGTHAQYTCVPQEGVIATKPRNMTYPEAAAVFEGALTALPFLRDKAKIKNGQKILIIGASGAVGTAAVQLAKYFGAQVTGVCSSANVKLVKSLGADKVIDYTKEDFKKNGQTYDIIFDTVGKSSFSRSKGSLKQKGIYLSTFLTMSILFQTLWTLKIGNKKAIFSATGLRPSGKKAKDLLFVKKLIEAGKLKSVIDRSYPLENMAEAHTYVDKGHKKGNVVITLKHNSKS